MSYSCVLSSENEIKSTSAGKLNILRGFLNLSPVAAVKFCCFALAGKSASDCAPGSL